MLAGCRGSYILKIYIVGDRFPLSRHEMNIINSISEFNIYIYCYYWFAIPITADVPFLTLQLWNDLKKWSLYGKKISQALLKKLDRQTWYSSGRHSPFSLFF